MTSIISFIIKINNSVIDLFSSITISSLLSGFHKYIEWIIVFELVYLL